MRWGKAAGSVAGGLVLACLSPCAPALAAAPANDDFADAQALPSSLPAEVSGSNVEATKEQFESVGIFAAGHSVWFKWEAPSTGFVSINGCKSSFHAVLGVFTGTALGSLTMVAGDNSGAGNGCEYTGAEYTFKATVGTVYEIAVDGNGFYLPESPKPITDGELTLRIEATPPPANDDFADAIPIEGRIDEEPGGDRFYFGSARGYNWGASKESGEPDHEGDQGGASVWYSWIAPETGDARVSACCGIGPVLLGIYTGNSVSALSPIAKDTVAGFPVSAGTKYYFAVDGKFNGGAGEAAMGSFSIDVGMPLTPNRGLPAGPALPARSAADTTPPQTTIAKRSIKAGKREAVFSFRSSESNGSFRCKLDRRRFAVCGSPKAYMHLKLGEHTLTVLAVDAAGNEDLTPAIAHFAIAKQQPR
ncbi:MAG TPA: hypothetical protein VH042_08495 [Solirubrobacterales bacterium]|jgi:hypothetical protein|nr:hypothetical protein [Solirubrobacterales bacterium]